jgi:hypothetical protein
MVGQGFALPGQLVHQGGEVLPDKLVEQSLLRVLAFKSDTTPGIPAWRMQAASTPGLPWQPVEE